MRPLDPRKLAGVVAALLSLSFPVYAADCAKYAMEPEVRFEFSRPPPSYKSVPSVRIAEIEGLSNPALSRGVTKADFFISYDFKLAGHQVDGGHCVAISEITFRMGYSSMDVMIDDRYKDGSCQYYVIRSHEAQHVKIHNDALERYIPLIRDEIRIASMNLAPAFVKSMRGADMDKILRRSVMESENIALLVRKMEEELSILNNELDAPEEYMRISSLCSDW